MASATLPPTSAIARPYDRPTLSMRSLPTVFGRRAAVVVSTAMPPFPHAHAHHAAETQHQQSSFSQLSQPLVTSDHRQQTISTSQISSTSSGFRPTMLVLGSTTTAATAAMAAEASIPTTFARLVVGAALALSTAYALLSSPASTLTGAAFSLPSTSTTSTSTSPASSESDSRTTTESASISTTSTSTTSTSTTNAPFATIMPTSSAAITINSLPVLKTQIEFDEFIRTTNRAGYLAIVLFHAPWCPASQRMQNELQRLSHLFIGRRVVFARVDCSIKQGVRPGAPMGQVPGPGFKLQRCDLTQLHRIHKTPTMRMYYHNACVDEIVGCRPVDFRQATSDLTFKYSL
ncbi:hypothetical protein Vafri_19104 [Volvox africanus]|uniref:Thioredoxin domain-containing protein n=1 Tax=Volvox africanus TaxID=51714 RepID=A0A8J4F921_9CHLO|nr:hypothetical protein Vafri_19104 [Volvox africanus]